MGQLIEIRNLKKMFNKEVLFDNFNLTIYEDEILVLMGPSGIGKSTLLNIIGQLDDDFTGTITYAPVLFEGIQVPFPFVFQDFDSILPWKTVEQNICLVKDGITVEELDHVLRMVSLEDHRNKYPAELSGGMKQRVGIGRALICKSRLLLMDEPFGSLDREMRRKLQDFVVELQKETGITIIMVTHDHDEAQRMGSRIVII